MSSRPRPTTVKPMTEPAEKATRRPRFSPSLAGIGGAAVGGGGDLHADEAGQAGEEAAGQEGEGYEPRQQTAGCHDAQHHHHAGEEHAYHGILALEVCVSTLTNGLGDLLHEGGALREAQHLLCGDDHKEKCNDGANKRG